MRQWRGSSGLRFRQEYSRWELQRVDREQQRRYITLRKGRKHASIASGPGDTEGSDYYASGMDEKTIEAMRAKPWMMSSRELTRSGSQWLLKEIARLHSIGVGVLFGLARADAKDSTHDIAQAV
jgi:predicted metalloendopeptidase